MPGIRKIKREEVLDFHHCFPVNDVAHDIYSYPEVYASYVLTLPSKSTRGHVTLLNKNMHRLIDVMRIDSLLFLGDSPTPWLYQQNEYKPVRAALDYLASQKINKRFNGGIEVFTSWLPDFIPHFFWLTRCNAALPTFYCTDCEDTFLGHICKYGNLHIDTLNERTDHRLRDAIAKTSFQYSDLTQCGSGAIDGRQMVI